MRSTVVINLFRVITALTILSSVPSLADEAVGTLPGSFVVTPTGAATYSVPIEVPPGINGMQPDLALVYNSQAGNGELGVGWSLSGISTITRCATNLEEDGSIDPVDYDSNDQFCLDGERLVLESGTHGRDGSIYRSASDSVLSAEVIGEFQSPEGGWNPSYWKIVYPGGVTAYFGAGETESGGVLDFGARILRDEMGGQVFAWDIAQKKDGFGNSISYTYINDSASGVHEISQVNFGPGHVVEFGRNSKIDTPARSDIVSGYLPGGGNYKIDTLLDSVKINGDLFEYVITYAQSGGQSLVSTITKCYIATGDCLSGKNFEWENHETGFEQAAYSLQNKLFFHEDSSFKYKEEGILRDINGDGLPDYSRATCWSNGNCDLKVYHNTGSGFVYANYDLPNQIYYHNASNYEYKEEGILEDFDADGKLDYSRATCWSNGNCDLKVYRNTGTGFIYAGYDLPNAVHYHNIDGWESKREGIIADFDGDGRPDYSRASCWSNNTCDLKIYRNTGSGFSYEGVNLPNKVFYHNAASYEYKNEGILNDFNGDGLVDYSRATCWSNGNCDLKIYYNYGNSFAYSGYDLPNAVHYHDAGGWNAKREGVVKDFNGDGLLDYSRATCWFNGSCDLKVYHNTGEGFEYANYDLPNKYYFHFASNYEFKEEGILEDLDGDGLVDYSRATCWSNGNCDLKVYRNSGQGFYYDGYDLPNAVHYHNASGNDSKREGVLRDIDGDGILDFSRATCWSNGSCDLAIHINKVSRKTVKHIIDSRSEMNIEISTGYLTESAVYTKYDDAIYPSFDLQSPLQVVTSVTQGTGSYDSNGDEYTAETTYTYEGLKIHTRGYGSLGFEKINVTESLTGFTKSTTYSQDWENHTVGMPLKEETIAPGGGVLSKTVNELAPFSPSAGIYKPYIASSSSLTTDLDGTPMTLVTSETTIDGKGRSSVQTSCNTSAVGYTLEDTPISCATIGLGDRNQTFAITYHEDTHPSGIPNLIKRKAVATTTPTDTKSKVIETYFLNSGAIDYEIETSDISAIDIEVESDDWLKTEYTYNDKGYVLSTTVSGADILPRSTSVVYDNGYISERTNALGHTAHNYYEDSRFPWLSSKSVNANGVQTIVHYDSFGQVYKTDYANGTSSEITKSWCTPSTCEANESYFVTTKTSGQPDSIVYSDYLGRPVRTVSSVYDGSNVRTLVQRTSYNARGLVEESTPAYFENDQVNDTTVTVYDLLDRPISVTDSAGRITNFSYQGLMTVTTNQLSQTQTTITNSIGKTTSINDFDGNTITYQHDALGNMVKADVPGVSQPTVVGYNARGHKISLSDADTGSWTYTRNVLGQLVSQTDAKGQKITITYDLLGRRIKRTDSSGSSDWTYDTAPHGIGRLASVTDNNGFTQSFTYNSYGWPLSSQTNIAGTVPQVFNNSVTYDALGRVENIVYPTGFTIKNNYEPTTGALIAVVNPVNNSPYWEPLEIDAKGQMIKSQLADLIEQTNEFDPLTGQITSIEAAIGVDQIQDLTYEWDNAGNLDHFKDAVANVEEYYSYDPHRRLTEVQTLNGSGNHYLRMDYDLMGNIIKKSTQSNGGPENQSVYTYGTPNQSFCGNGSHAGPHAVTGISGGSIAGDYCYDENGSLIKNGARTLAYTEFNKPHTITLGSSAQVSFKYGPDRNRYKREETSNGQSTTTFYGKGYEKVINGTNVTHRFYVGGVAIVTKKNSDAPQTKYLLKDLLGSTNVILAHNGTVEEYLSFDAWGNRREISLEPLADPFSFTSQTTLRGFTGHESLDSIGLIHMNGRVFDPAISRFISADPFVQSPGNRQSYNRYSYVFNNPFSGTDPTGYLSVSDLDPTKHHKKLRDASRNLRNEIDRAWEKSHFLTPGHALAKNTHKWWSKRAHKEHMRFRQSFWLTRHEDDEMRRNRDLRNLGTIVAAVADIWCGGYCSAGYAAYLTAIMGGDYMDVQKSFSQSYAMAQVMDGLNLKFTHQMMVNGAISSAQGGKFIDGVKGSLVTSLGAAALSGLIQNTRSYTCRSPCNGEVIVNASTPEEYQLALAHMETLLGDPDVNQASLIIAMYDTLNLAARARVRVISYAEAGIGAFNRANRQNQRLMAAYFAVTVGGPLAFEAGMAVRTAWAAMSSSKQEQAIKLLLTSLKKFNKEFGAAADDLDVLAGGLKAPKYSTDPLPQPRSVYGAPP